MRGDQQGEAKPHVRAGEHSFGDDDLEELALQIRNPNYEHNGDMPGYTDLRLNNQQLLDLIAWFRK